MLDSFLVEFNKAPNIWIFSILFLIVLCYAALKIKNEPNDYLKKSHLLPFNGFLLRIPSWWTTIINENDLIRFERTDTRYDWFAEFWIKETSLAPEILLTKLINSLKVTFDDNDDFEQFTLKSSNEDQSISPEKKGCPRSTELSEHTLIYLLQVQKTARFSLKVILQYLMDVLKALTLKKSFKD